MATFDQLSDEQRAIVELVLRRGKSYEELSDVLGVPQTRVRDRDYRFIGLTALTVRGGSQDPSFESGPSVLRGLLELREQPVARGRGENRITLLGEIRMLPLPE